MPIKGCQSQESPASESQQSFQSLSFAKGRDESGALLEQGSKLGEDVWDGNCSDGGEVSAAAFETAEARADALDARTHARTRTEARGASRLRLVGPSSRLPARARPPPMTARGSKRAAQGKRNFGGNSAPARNLFCNSGVLRNNRAKVAVFELSHSRA